MPSAKYSWAGSPLMFVNGRIAIDGLAGSGNAVSARSGPASGSGSASAEVTRCARTGSGMFLTRCSPELMEAHGQLVPRLGGDDVGDADAPRLRQCLKALVTFTPSP